MKISILYEDSDILVINKPNGILVHPDGQSKEKTISDYFLKKYPEMEEVGESIFNQGKEIKKPGIVHRLDKETSGALILAKNQKAFIFLKKQFSEQKIKKTYFALVFGWLKQDQGIIDKPIGRSPNDFRRRLAGRGARGLLRQALTEYQVLKRFIINKKETENQIKVSLVAIYPKTGRTHQIRVHFKFLNHPLLNDQLYNPKGFYFSELKYLALHASQIEFQNLKNDFLKIIAPPPVKFKKFLSGIDLN